MPSFTHNRAALGLPPILIGLLLYVVGRSFDGFLGGLLDGVTIVLMILGAILVGLGLPSSREGGRAWWRPSEEGLEDHWLPSRDHDVAPDRLPHEGDE